MGREVRMVPKNWEHPKDEKGNYIPMHTEFPYEQSEVEEGLRDGWLCGEPPHYDVDVMPDFKPEEKTHYQMYETCTEGTPISPVFESPQKLARWLADNNASSFASHTATYEQWLRLILSCEESVSCILSNGNLVSGVEAGI